MEKWFKNALFYEIYPTSFKDSNKDGIGDLNGIAEKLEYIKSIGFDAIWVNPFYKSPFLDGGYDVSDYYEVDEKFGTMKDFENLVAKVHQLKMKIIIDLIPGHTSEQNPMFIESGKPQKNKYTDLYIWNDSVWKYQNPYILISGRHDRDANYLVNFFAHQPALNYGFYKITDDKWQMSYKDERTFQARQLMIDVMNFYLAKGVDGFRVDMAAFLVKNDEDKKGTIEVWNDMISKVKSKYPDCFFLSEWSYPNKSLKAGFDADFILDVEDNFYHHLARSTSETGNDCVLKGGKTDFFEKSLLENINWAKEFNGSISIISGNHDETRIASLLSFQELKLFYLMQYTLPGIPFMYYGDEIGMKQANLTSKDGGYRRTGARTPMQWDNTINKGFSYSTGDLYLPINEDNISVENELKEDNSLLNYLKELLKIRKKHPNLANNNIELTIENHIIQYQRDDLMVMINLTNKNVTIDSSKIVFATQKEISTTLNPCEGVIIKKG